MNLKIIAGPANSGKSQRLCREIVEAAAGAPGENFIAIVPEQFTLQMQRRIVETSKNHAVMNIDIVSFNRLALKVFGDLGINLNEVLDDTGKALVLRKVLDENSNKLCLYRKKVHMEGFIDEMKSAITEFKSYGVSPGRLEEESQKNEGENPELSEKLRDISLIYKKFNEEIENIYTTSEEVPDLFARVLYRSGRLKGVNVYLDGFTGFTPVQYKIIEGFLSICRSVTCMITAPEDKLKGTCPEGDIFALPNETYRRLTDMASRLGIKTELCSYGHVSRQMAEEDLVNPAEGSSARVFEYKGRNKRDEAFFAAEKISALVREEGLRYREIAVVTTDMEGYCPYLEQAFARMKTPAFIDHKSRITDNRLSKYVLSALKVVKERFSYDSVFSYLKCGLSDLKDDDICLLENYCLEFGIKGPVVWNRPFLKNRTLRGGEMAWDLEQMNSLREKVMASLSGFASKAAKARTAEDFALAFERLFADNNIEEKLKEISEALNKAGRVRQAQEYEQIFGTVTALFEKAGTLTRGSKISVDDYIKIIRGGIREIKIGLIPPTLDMVTAGDLERSRLNKIKALFILGSSEGSLPKAGKGKSLLNENDRKLLKKADLPLAPSRAESFYSQRYYLYLMLNKPKKYLYLCRTGTDENGDALNRSSVFDELDEYIEGPSKVIESISEDEKRPYYDEEEGIIRLSGQVGRFARSADESVIDKNLLKYFARRRPNEVLKIIESAFYANKESLLDKEISIALYGAELKGSVSRIESFNECAFRHFLSYGLDIGPRPEYEMKAAALGTIYHSALEIYVDSISDAGLSLRYIDDETSHRLAREAAETAISREESKIFESSARMRYQAERTIRVVEKTTDLIREDIRGGNFDAWAAERRFRVSFKDGNIFSGVIDRIDVYDTGDDIFVNIIDYKTGSKEFKLKEVVSGTQLQLPVYLYLAADILQKNDPEKQVHPVGIYYFLVRDEFEKEELKGKKGTYLKGLTDNEERMKILMDYAAGKILEAGRKIKAGEVSPSPLKENGKIRSCEYCDFKEICRFKEGEFSAKAREIKNLDAAQLEEEIYGEF